MKLLVLCIALAWAPFALGAQQGAMLERNHTLEEQHESNGPEGSEGVPMQRLQLPWLVAIVFLMLASGTLVFYCNPKENPRA